MNTVARMSNNRRTLRLKVRRKKLKRLNMNEKRKLFGVEQ